jgi:hypothetical protein
MTWKYKALALGAGFTAALALSACGRHHKAANPEATAPTAESAAPAAPTSGAEGTMGAPAESGAPAGSSAPANPGG